MTTVAAVYLRQSLDREGNELGIARQREDCLKLAADKGWKAQEYVDNDTSASSGKVRPSYERMLSDIRDGYIGAVVAWDLDRLHRRPIELESFMALADAEQIKLATVSGDVDLSTAQGRLVARLKGSVAAHEIEHKRARQIRAAKQKAESGRPQWRRAFGYIDTPVGPQLDPEKAPLVEEAYRSLIAGSSLKEIATNLNDAGAVGLNGCRWTESSLANFLHSPRNAGLRFHNGEYVRKGTWEPLVSESIWNQAQRVMESRPGGGKKQRRTMRKYLLSGLLLCGREGCNGHLNGRMKETGKSAYICTKRRCVSVLADDVEPFVIRLIGTRLARKDSQKLLKADIDPAQAQKISDEKADIYSESERLGKQLGQGKLTDIAINAALEELQTRLDALEAQEQDAEKLRVLDGIPLGRPEAIQAVADLSPDRFRALVTLICRITVMPVGKGSHLFNPRRIVVTPI